jgi:hypothetical protein
MCGFQAPGRGFFYMPDHSTAKNTKERASSVVITVTGGNATSREIEHEFNIIFGDSWRCTARTIGPNQYIMRFPTPREVERAVCYGSSMHLKTVDATVRLTAWNASIGAKAPLQKAWVRISNIPLDKRVEENVFYAGSLVGVSLDMDASTLHKPEYVRVLVGCREVDLIPNSAEGCLGDNFYDFFYEIDKVVVGGPPKQDATVTVGDSGAPSPKRARVEQRSATVEESSENQVYSSQTETIGHGRNHGASDVVQESDVEHESEDDDCPGGDELLIESMAREHEASKLSGTVAPANSWLVPCSFVQNVHAPVHEGNDTVQSMLLPHTYTLSHDAWPPLPSIAEVTDGSNSPLIGSPAYVVQSPDASPEEFHDSDYTVPDSSPTRCSSRLQPQINMNIMDKMANVSKKRNLEGTHDPPQNPASSNSFAALSDNALMLKAYKMGVKIPDNDFSAIKMIRDLETARSDLSSKNNVKNPICFVYRE